MKKLRFTSVAGLAVASVVSFLPTASAAVAPEIDPNSSYLLPDDGVQTNVTCRAAAADNTIRAFRIGGGRFLPEPPAVTVSHLETSFSLNPNVKLTAKRDALISDSALPGGRAGVTTGPSGTQVVVLGWAGMRSALGFDGFDAEVVRAGRLGNRVENREQTFAFDSVTGQKIFNGLYGPNAADNLLPDFSPPTLRSGPSFYLVLDSAKGYAAGRGYLVDESGGESFVFPSDVDEQGFDVLPLDRAYEEFTCRAHRIGR
jgi:hypothetical protein